ncbi:Uncharacterised protein [uncultured archaeon]|nr:Uncharacterised protein [uncultured archaeon]
MIRFTDEQKKIAFALYGGPKSVEELNSTLSIPFDRLNTQLKGMLGLGLVKVEGYPQKYFLSEAVAKGVKARKEIAEKDPFDLRLKAVIEFKAVELGLLEKSISEIESKLRSNRDYVIYDIYKAEPQKLEGQGHYSSYLELNLSAKDFTSIVKFMYFFGPSSVEVLKPQKVVLSMYDLQEALMEMADMIQSYNASMIKSMSKEELNEFAKKLYSPNP